jgi:hypothetical protein
MAFTAAELANIANAALNFYFERGSVFRQTLQARPLWDKLEGKKKTFPGGKGAISLAVEGAYGDGSGNDVVKGFTHNDKVAFMTPANILRAEYKWFEHHIGLTLTMTELKIDGISVKDTNGESTSNHSQRELTALVNLLEDKIFGLGEQYVRGMNNLAYGDGTGDPKAMIGLQALVKADPSTGTVGGLDQAANTWWRNRARTAAFGAKVTGTPALSAFGGDAVTSNVADGGALLQVLQFEQRQLSRYGSKPDFAVCGSAFLDALEREVRANGLMTTNGYTGTQQIDMGSIKWGGVEFKYDPTLDDLGFSKRCYWLDTDAIRLFAMDQEWRKDHVPARPSDVFVIFRSITSTGAMAASRLNSSLVIDIK